MTMTMMVMKTMIIGRRTISVSTTIDATSAMNGAVKRPAHFIRDADDGTFLRADDLPGRPAANRKALSRAVEAGELTKVAHGIYFKARKSRYGMTRPSTESILKAVLGFGYGPSGHSAAVMWGLTTQVPPRMTVASVVPSDALPGVEILHRSNAARSRLSPPAVALLELLRDPSAFVEAGWDALVEAVNEALHRGTVNLDEVEAVGRRERNAAIRANLKRLRRDLSAAMPEAA